MDWRTNRKNIHAGMAALLFALSGCGSNSNVNQIWWSEKSTESKLIEAKAAYDRGDFSSAIDMASSLIEINPDHEEAAILLGYAYLSQGGLDPYRVASCLVNMASTSTSSKSSSSNSTSTRCQPTNQSSGASLVSFDDPIESWFTAGTTTGSTSSSNSDTSVLTKLQTGLLSLSEEDFAKLKKGDLASSSGLFGGTTALIVPVEVDDNLRESVSILRNLNYAVRNVCRFVNDTSEIKADSSRYKTGCDLTSYSRKNAAKAHYLWAISHLGEALTFTSVILYNSGDSSSYNFQRASSQLSNLSTSSVENIVTQVDEMQKAVASIFDTENSNSMISKTLYDLNSTSSAFDAIAGLPDSVKDQISKILDGVKSVGKTISGSGSEVKALKTRLLETVTTTVSKKVNDTIASVAGVSDPSQVTPDVVKKLDASKQAQVSQLCTSYDSLTKDNPADKRAANKPIACG